MSVIKSNAASVAFRNVTKVYPGSKAAAVCDCHQHAGVAIWA